VVRHKEITLLPKSRGFHIITQEILSQLALPEEGILNLFIKHTSAGLAINENADPDVLTDFESIYNKLVPENMPFLTHTVEGPDDMPAHIKASMVGASVTIPVSKSKLMFGTWQGIYLCEFRNHGGSRRIVASIYE